MVAERVLPGWDLSLAFVAPLQARGLNEELRGKSYVPNVLSYESGRKSGEIVICLSEAAKQAKSYGMTERAFVLYLFIHAVLHLKGWVHGGTMEKRERKLLAEFATSGAKPLPNETTNRNRHRHRHVPSKDGRRRGVLR
jgi:rRNA maturation RNase YbeY